MAKADVRASVHSQSGPPTSGDPTATPSFQLSSQLQSFLQNLKRWKMFGRTQVIMRRLASLLLAGLPAILMANPAGPASTANPPAANAAGAMPAPAVNPPAAGVPPANTPVSPVAEFTEEQLLTEAGWFVGKRSQLAELGFTEDQLAIILRGIKLSLEGKDGPLPPEMAGPRITTYMQNRMQVARANAQKAAEAKETAFFADLKSKGVLSTPSGLYYEIIQPGTEKKPAANSSVTVNYTGRLLDGKVFDSSVARGKPAVFQLNRLIRGWAEGLQLIGEGGKIKLYVPFALAYGPRNQPNIPSFSTLEFEVELVGVSPPPVQPPPVGRPAVNPSPAMPAPGIPAPAAPVPSKTAPSSPGPSSPAPANSPGK